VSRAGGDQSLIALMTGGVSWRRERQERMNRETNRIHSIDAGEGFLERVLRVVNVRRGGKGP
jgi:uncharacterized membrane protein YdbT with pleckstrin-like domain